MHASDNRKKKQIFIVIMILLLIAFLVRKLIYIDPKDPVFTGELAPYHGNINGIQYQGIREKADQKVLLFKFFNSTEKQVTFWSCNTLVLNTNLKKWEVAPPVGPDFVSVPPKHSSVFEIPAPKETVTWRATFDRHYQKRDRIVGFKKLNWLFSVESVPENRNYLGNFASPFMRGSSPVTEKLNAELNQIPLPENETYSRPHSLMNP